MARIPLSENEKGRKVVTILSVFMALDIVFVSARFWARRLRKQSLSFNDWALLAALVSTSGMYAVITALVLYGGAGLHVMDLIQNYGGMPTIFTAGKLVLSADILWNTSTLIIKLSILSLYLSIFGVTSKRFRMVVYIVMGICVASTVIFIIQILVLCRPLPFFWDKSLNGTCGSLPLTYLIPSLIITVEDITVFALPMPLLWRLQASTSKRLGAMFVFGLGFGICLVAGVRIKYVLVVKVEDFTETIWMFAIFGGLEPMLGIICACLPIVPALVAHYSKNRIMNWSTRGRSGEHSFKRAFGKNVSNSSGRSGKNDFERLGDGDYPLIEQPGSVGSAGDITVEGIKVTKGYTVDTQSIHRKSERGMV